MAKQGQEQPIDVNKIKMNLPDNLKGGIYANTLRVVATNTEVTLDFAYITGDPENPTGTIVSRIIVPPVFAQNIINSLSQVVEAQEKAKL